MLRHGTGLALQGSEVVRLPAVEVGADQAGAAVGVLGAGAALSPEYSGLKLASKKHPVYNIYLHRYVGIFLFKIVKKTLTLKTLINLSKIVKFLLSRQTYPPPDGPAIVVAVTLPVLPAPALGRPQQAAVGPLLARPGGLDQKYGGAE